MNIQISVLIWTILSFTAVVFILDKLLFQPVFSVMDQRNQKIEADRSAKKAAQEEAQRKMEEAEQSRIQAQNEAIAQGEAVLEKARSETAEAVAAKKAEYDAMLELRRQELETEARQIEENLSGEIGELAMEYVKTLLR